MRRRWLSRAALLAVLAAPLAGCYYAPAPYYGYGYGYGYAPYSYYAPGYYAAPGYGGVVVGGGGRGWR